MKILSKKDVLSAIATGLTTGISAWLILLYLGKLLPLGIDPAVLPVLVPILWIVGVQFGYALGAVYAPLTQFGRFCAVGFANAAVDFGVLYILIAITGLAAGLAYIVFKAISFASGTVHSYLWNKYWAFDAGARQRPGEIERFVGVSIVSIIVNVGISYLTLAFRPGHVAPNVWAGIAAVAGSAVALIFSFIGFRVFVFGKKA